MTSHEFGDGPGGSSGKTVDGAEGDTGGLPTSAQGPGSPVGKPPVPPDALRRRDFLVGSTALAAAGLAAPSARGDGPHATGAGLTATSASPHARVRSVGLGEVKWTRGFWAERFAVCREAMVPGMWKVMEGTEPSQFYHNLRIAAGEAEGRHRG